MKNPNITDEYSYTPHNFVYWKKIGKSVCVNCGLIPANNKFSEWATKMGCENRQHPAYTRKRLQFTELFT